MEEFIGKLWHNWVTKAAAGYYPQAAVKLAEVEKTAGILFRAFGGDPGLNVAAATTEAHGARRRWLQRVAGSNEKAALARRDAETLRLPPEIAAFPEKSLNRDLYLWLAALAASDVAPHRPWFIRNQLASQAALARYPGLWPRYERLVAAHLAGRIDPAQLQADEAAQERAIRQALQQPAAVRRPAAAQFPEIASAAAGTVVDDRGARTRAGRRRRPRRPPAARRQRQQGRREGSAQGRAGRDPGKQGAHARHVPRREPADLGRVRACQSRLR